jgi:hypothetical protein
MLKLLFRIVVVVGLMVVALALVFAAIIGIDSIGAAEAGRGDQRQHRQ